MWTWTWLRGELVRQGGEDLAATLPAQVEDEVLVFAIGEWVARTSLPLLLGLLGEHGTATAVAQVAPVVDKRTAWAARLAIGDAIEVASARRRGGEEAADLHRLLVQAQACVSYLEAHPTINQFARYLGLHLQIGPQARESRVTMAPHLATFAKLIGQRCEA